MALDPYIVGLTVIGAAIVGVALLPRLLTRQPLSIPIVYVMLGIVVFSLPVGLPSPNPLQHGVIAEHLTELGVILALMGAGLKIDRAPGVWRWETTWRMLGIAMPLTIVAVTLLGWGVIGLAPASAILLGAVVAPTDPVLASSVQVEEPGEGAEDELLAGEEGYRHEVGFALTSEAGLNDGLAFPFTYLAILVAGVGLQPSGWALEWVSYYFLYRIVVGVLAGIALGWVLAQIVFSTTAESDLSRSVHGLEALGGTLLFYGATELVHGYGFLAVFVAAIVFRQYERSDEYYDTVHTVAEMSEQVLMVVVMLLFGGAIASGMLASLQVYDVLVATALVFVIRPVAGLIGLVGFERRLGERLVTSFYGIRGIGSFYYLAYAINNAQFPGTERLWAIVGYVVLLSVLVHGITAATAVEHLTREPAAPQEEE